jgi:predicted transcriptional regulator
MRWIVWHSREYMQLQSGLGRSAFDSRLKKLREVGLVDVKKSPTVPNKDYFIVYDPLDRDAFIKKYAAEVSDFFAKLEELEKRTQEDRDRRQRAELRKIQAEIALRNAGN